MSDKNIRIFISSPNDVQEERNKAKAVVEQLQRTFAGRLQITALLWEDFGLRSDMSFQEGIDLVLSQVGVDVAVFILWSRLGTPTGPLMIGPNRREFRSGTEREWQLMLQAREQCQQQGLPVRPDLMVYTRQDDASFVERLRGKSDDEREQEEGQKKAVKQFISEEFTDTETGTNLRAYHSFDHPTTFSRQLRTHLTTLLESMCGEANQRVFWDPAQQGPPFRGLEVFEFEHSPIFFGREDEIIAIRSHLKEQASRGCAFLLISGASGSGKSSLARAGVLPDICAHELDKDIRQWRSMAVRPSELGADLLDGLLQKICSDTVLPELRRWSEDIVIPTDRSDLRDWIARLGLRIKDALTDDGKEGHRLIILVDQLEELFAQRTAAYDACPVFFEVLEALARLRVVWVVATVRSDFYQECQAIPALVRMKEGLGHYDLVPPGPDDLLRVISGPATLAGLRFEQHEEQSLADLILREATGQAELLPLIEHLLRDLYDHRSPEGVLTLDRYRAIGGLPGALRKHCETTFYELPRDAQAAFGRVFSQLVNISGENLDTAVRRTIPVTLFAADKAAAELIEKLVVARLLSTGVDSGGRALVSVSHEAVLRSWPRVADWIAENREQLRVRTRLEQAETRWREQQDDSLLLQRGIPLQEAQRLSHLAPELLTTETKEFVKRSVSFEAARMAKQQRTRAITLGIVVCVVLISSWFVQRSLMQSRVRGLVDGLAKAEPNRLSEIIFDLRPYRSVTSQYLQPLLALSPKTPSERQTLLHARLAMVGDDESLVEPLLEELLTGKVTYVMPIRQQLKPHLAVIAGRLQQLFHDEKADPQRRFRAAMALADYVPAADQNFWTEPDAAFIVQQLVRENSEFQPLVREALRPIHGKLLEALEAIFV
ncbi:MAG: AAA family ATPase, partial [Planctomycetota bacterium]